MRLQTRNNPKLVAAIRNSIAATCGLRYASTASAQPRHHGLLTVDPGGVAPALAPVTGRTSW